MPEGLGGTINIIGPTAIDIQDDGIKVFLGATICHCSKTYLKEI